MKYTTSGLFLEFKGRLGNAVASSNAVSPFLRNFVYPINSFTAKKQTYKTRWLSCVDYWRSASSIIKNLYTSKAVTYTWTDNMGNTYHPNAFQLFMYLNMNIFPASSLFIASPQNYALLSDPWTAGSPYTYGVSWPEPITWTQDNANEFLKYFVAAPYYQSSKKTNVPWRFLTIVTSNAAPYDMKPEFDTLIGGLISVGLKIYFRALKVNKLTGLCAVPKDSWTYVEPHP